jgi:hypothetical protein
MERRAVLKIVAMTALSQKLHALPGASMEHMQAPPAAPSTPYTKRFFTEDESQFLDQVMELIIPADDHSPGAHEAQTSLFADMMVALSTKAVQKQWRDGIRMMREEAEHSSPSDALHKASLNEEDPKSDLEQFFVVLKSMTVDGYYTSATGIHKDMGYIGNAYLGAFPGCNHLDHKEA